MSHLTCVNATREEIHSVVEQARALGIKNILALRGDPPGGSGEWKKTEGGFEYSTNSSATSANSAASASAPPVSEGHIACTEGREVDWRRLKAKIDCGADFVITQLFRQRRLFPVPRFPRQARQSGADFSRHHSDSQRRTD